MEKNRKQRSVPSEDASAATPDPKRSDQRLSPDKRVEEAHLGDKQEESSVETAIGSSPPRANGGPGWTPSPSAQFTPSAPDTLATQPETPPTRNLAQAFDEEAGKEGTTGGTLQGTGRGAIQCGGTGWKNTEPRRKYLEHDEEGEAQKKFTEEEQRQWEEAYQKEWDKYHAAGQEVEERRRLEEDQYADQDEVNNEEVDKEVIALWAKNHAAVVELRAAAAKRAANTANPAATESQAETAHNNDEQENTARLAELQVVAAQAQAEAVEAAKVAAAAAEKATAATAELEAATTPAGATAAVVTPNSTKLLSPPKDARGLRLIGETKEDNPMEGDGYASDATESNRAKSKDDHIGRQRKYCFRYDLRMRLPPSTNTNETRHTALKEFFNELQGRDASVTVCPWKKEQWTDQKHIITKADDISKMPSKWRDFFPTRSKANQKGGDFYVSACIAHDENMETIKEDIQDALMNKKFFIYLKQLQTEETAQLGFCFGSTRFTDCDALMRYFWDKHRVRVGIRWRRASKPEDLKLEANHYAPHGIHFEVAAKDEERAGPIIRRYYSATSTSWPLQEKMRLVPEMKNQQATDSRQRSLRMWNKQHGYLDNVKSDTRFEIAPGMLDQQVSQSFENTLRELIMRIPAVGKKWNSKRFKPLFMGIDQQFRSSGYVFSFLPANASVARPMLAGILPYLRHFYPEMAGDLDKCFTPEAVIRANKTRWDPERGAISEEDDAIAALVDNPDDDEMLFDLTEMEIPEADNTASDGGTSGSESTLTDSVPTFNPGEAPTGEKAKTKRPKKLSSAQLAKALLAAERMKQADGDAASDSQSAGSSARSSSGGSTASSLTNKSRITAMEASVSGLQTSMDRLMALMTEKVANERSTPPRSKYRTPPVVHQRPTHQENNRNNAQPPNHNNNNKNTTNNNSNNNREYNQGQNALGNNNNPKANQQSQPAAEIAGSGD